MAKSKVIWNLVVFNQYTNDWYVRNHFRTKRNAQMWMSDELIDMMNNKDCKVLESNPNSIKIEGIFGGITHYKVERYTPKPNEVIRYTL